MTHNYRCYIVVGWIETLLLQQSLVWLLDVGANHSLLLIVQYWDQTNTICFSQVVWDFGDQLFGNGHCSCLNLVPQKPKCFIQNFFNKFWLQKFRLINASSNKLVFTRFGEKLSKKFRRWNHVLLKSRILIMRLIQLFMLHI